MIIDVVLQMSKDLKGDLLLFIGFLLVIELIKTIFKRSRQLLLDEAEQKVLNRRNASRELFAASMTPREQAYVRRLERRYALRNYARGR